MRRESSRVDWRRLLRLSLVFWLPLFFFLLQILLLRHPGWGECYARYVFPIFSAPVAFFSSLIPISLAFLAVLALIPGILYYLYRLLRALLSGTGRGRLIRRLLYRLLLFCSVLYCVFMLFHGLNYGRQPLTVNLGLNQNKHTVGALYETALWLGDKAAVARVGLETDARGQLSLPRERDYYLRHAQDDPLPLLQGVRVLPKPVPLSHEWSYTNTTGMYFPFFCEANVNMDTRPDEFLFSILHEVSHVHGFAREDEANFWAFYSGIKHPDPYFRYAGWESAFIYCSNRLYAEAPALYNQLCMQLNPGVAIDIEARTRYWKPFEGKTEEITKRANDRFLQANGQTAGIKSYGEVVDLLLAYYDKVMGTAVTRR